MDVLTSIQQHLDDMQVKKKEMVKTLQTEFPQLLKPLFEKSKRIESVGWRQYTPYFNDGDECVFGVHYDDLAINGIDEYSDEGSGRRFIEKKVWDGKGYVTNPDYDETEGSVLEEIQTVLKKIPDEFYKELFGDHVRVTIYKDGRVETEEYDHD